MECIRIKAARFQFIARFETERAPRTCAKFRAMLPYKERIIHVRWSGEGCWIPLGDLDLGLQYENQTSYPAPGEIIVYPGAHHDFDRANTPLRVRTGLVRTDDPSGVAHGGTNPAARSDALKRVPEWLAR